jgi:hypothetical protein
VIAALFVQTGGVYFGLPDVDPWDEARDARLYVGPWPVVAHPPCARWSTLAYVNRARYGIQIGDDDGCFASALDSVRRWGGVLEHPRNSVAFATFGLPRPVRGAWVGSRADGWVTEVAQRNYGHRANKFTWLYAFAVDPPTMDWRRPAPPEAWISSDRPRAELAAKGVEYMGKRERARTPIQFRDLLLSIARSYHVEAAA